MFSRLGRSMILLGAMAQFVVLLPFATPAHAQGWDGRPNWQHGQGARFREEQNRRDWERKRRDDARTNGIVAGVIGTAVVAGLIAAAANSSKDDPQRARADYCRNRYGNYDQTSDSYQASNGYFYRCE